MSRPCGLRTDWLDRSTMRFNARQVHRAVAALSLAICGCSVVIIDASPQEHEAGATGSPGGEDESGAPTGSSSGDGEIATDSIGDEPTGNAPAGESTGSDESTGDASTGPELLPNGAACDGTIECESGMCGPLSTCNPQCITGGCVGPTTCLGGACIDIGYDDDRGNGLAVNDSPSGTINKADDVDPYRFQLEDWGAYELMVHGLGVSVYVVNQDGNVLASPGDEMDIDDGTVTKRVFDFDGLPITVLVIGPDAQVPTDYYLWLVQVP